MAIKEITSRIPSEDIQFDLVTLRFKRSHPKFEKRGSLNIYRIGGGFGYLSKILFVPQAALFALDKQHDFYWAMMTNMLFPITILRLLGKKVPYVLNLQDGDPFTHVFNRLRILPFLPLLKYGFRKASKIQAISSFLAGWAKQMGYIGSPYVIPNGVNIKKFSPVQHRVLNNHQVILITTSRLVEKNGIKDLIDAMKFLPDNVHLKILGTGPLESKLKHHSRILNLESRINFVGEVSHNELPKYLHDSDIFIRPSLSEGMGNSFIEAMAAGLPIIGTPVGGITDFLKDGETGIFCEPNNPESIVRAVTRLIDNPELRQKIIGNAQKLVCQKYDWDLIANEMKNLVFKA